jgi:hypothetical protein
MTEEIIASAVATAVTVVGVLKGVAYLTEKRNERNGTGEKYMTLAACKECRDGCALTRAELKADNLLYRSDVKADTTAYRTSADDRSNIMNTKIEVMQKDLKLEILELRKVLSEKIDRIVENLPKKAGR